MSTTRIKFLIIRNKFRNCHRKTVILNPRIKNYLMKHIRNQVLLNLYKVNLMNCRESIKYFKERMNLFCKKNQNK